MEKEILSVLARKGFQRVPLRRLLATLNLSPNDKGKVMKTLQDLVKAGRVVRFPGSRFSLNVAQGNSPATPRAGHPLPARQRDPGPARNREPLPPRERRRDAEESGNLLEGVIRINRAGKGFFKPDDPNEKEVEVPFNQVGTALNNDRVTIKKTGRARFQNRNGERAMEARVVEVVDRTRKQLVGTLEVSGSNYFVIPDDPRLPDRIPVPEPRDVGRKGLPGDKVVVALAAWNPNQNSIRGRVVEVLGSMDEEGVDMLSVIRNYELPLSFPEAVLTEANAISPDISDADLQGRKDCRGDMVITIDPFDAKDFDDAICIKRIASDKFRAWVHIADVSHYVRPGTALDEEASKRGNSTYLVDRVIPMLPEALSNGICSLKPGVDRLTKCVEFVLSEQGEVLESHFYSAVIHSQKRYTYQEAYAAIQRKPQDDIERMLHLANTVAQSVRKKRFAAGALELDFPEVKIILDENGKALRTDLVVNDLSHQLIEEYMLLANDAVAKQTKNNRIVSVYRVHEEPEERRLQEFRKELIEYGLKIGDLTKRTEIQKMLVMLSQVPEGPALKVNFLRSLMRARYAHEPIGHYGLAKNNYTHFTSPIRRYADLLVHRAVFEGGKKLNTRQISEIADHISKTERNSSDAERDSKEVKLFAFLRGQLESGERQVYDAIVLDILPHGFFVDLPMLGVGGFVKASVPFGLKQRPKEAPRLGGIVKVQVAKVDTAKKQVDFALATDRPEPKQAPKKAVWFYEDS